MSSRQGSHQKYKKSSSVELVKIHHRHTLRERHRKIVDCIDHPC